LLAFSNILVFPKNTILGSVGIISNHLVIVIKTDQIGCFDHKKSNKTRPATHVKQGKMKKDEKKMKKILQIIKRLSSCPYRQRDKPTNQ